MLWASAIERGFAAPIWMTFKQAFELNAPMRKGEKGSLVVYANSITKTGDDGSGNEVEREIPFMRGYRFLISSRSKACPNTATPGRKVGLRCWCIS